jgi:hypothetical protein
MENMIGGVSTPHGVTIKVDLAFDQIVVIFFPGSGLHMKLHLDQPEDVSEIADALHAVVEGRRDYNVNISGKPSLSVYRYGYEDGVNVSIGFDEDFMSAYMKLSDGEARSLESLLRAAAARLERHLEAAEQTQAIRF